jgi:hypothetical protein
MISTREDAQHYLATLHAFFLPRLESRFGAVIPGFLFLNWS